MIQETPYTHHDCSSACKPNPSLTLLGSNRSLKSSLDVKLRATFHIHMCYGSPLRYMRNKVSSECGGDVTASHAVPT